MHVFERLSFSRIYFYQSNLRFKTQIKDFGVGASKIELKRTESIRDLLRRLFLYLQIPL